MTESKHHVGAIAGTGRQPPVAGWSEAGLGTYRVYADGRLEGECRTSVGPEPVTGSIIGAAASVERSGGRMLFRDTRRALLRIEGPRVQIAVRLRNNVGLGAAQAFASEVNRLAAHLAPVRAVGAAESPLPARIGCLAELRERGVLTDREFEQAKRRLLAEA